MDNHASELRREQGIRYWRKSPRIGRMVREPGSRTTGSSNVLVASADPNANMSAKTAEFFVRRP